MVKVFASLPQQIMWKWDQETMEDLPPNVMLSKWFPQQDILGEVAFLSRQGVRTSDKSQPTISSLKVLDSIYAIFDYVSHTGIFRHAIKIQHILSLLQLRGYLNKKILIISYLTNGQNAIFISLFVRK